ncbi:Chromodomain helicase DNA binding protein [Allomyces javanicus]|nr:Chromodomain helicase DNA binding protein [Allomyces javanicus]
MSDPSRPYPGGPPPAAAMYRGAAYPSPGVAAPTNVATAGARPYFAANPFLASQSDSPSPSWTPPPPPARATVAGKVPAVAGKVPAVAGKVPASAAAMAAQRRKRAPRIAVDSGDDATSTDEEEDDDDDDEDTSSLGAVASKAPPVPAARARAPAAAYRRNAGNTSESDLSSADDDDDMDVDVDSSDESDAGSTRSAPRRRAAAAIAKTKPRGTSSPARGRRAGSSRAGTPTGSSSSSGGTSWRVPYDSVVIPFAHFEPKVVEKLLAHRPDSSVPGTREFLVKWKHWSYLHREWVPQATIEAQVNGGQRIKRFLDKQNAVDHAVWGDDGFNPAYLRIDRILDEGEVRDARGTDDVYYLVKWENLSYDQATWETKDTCDEMNPDAVAEFHARRDVPAYKRALTPPKPSVDQWTKYPASPAFKNGNQLRAYQLEGVNWLLHCWLRNQSSIMADEMGLGKTVQSVSFLYQLWREFGVRGPFLVVAPLSTVPHWEREFKHWTDMNVIVYHGNAASRNLIVDTEYYWKDARGALVPNVFKFDVLITTYEMAMAGVAQLRPIQWRACVLDEAHKLKNKSSKISELLKGFSMDHRVLLTGTPLQNSLDELWALLHFLEPDKFPSEKSFMAQYGSLKTSSDVERLQQLLQPLMLRRLKEDVEKSIPIKEETVVEVELTNIQKKWYRAILERNFSMLKKGAKGRDSLPSLINVVMELRKCCIHPYLLAGAEDLILTDANANSPEQQYQCMVQASGKLVLLDKLLRKLQAGGHKVLIFSQMTKCLDILADYLRGQSYRFERIDGNIRGSERQAAIDRFSAPESESFVFLLCTRAGGVGINLTAADTAIIFDSDWNPQNDLQAQARCHRIGQKKPVQIYRLITRNTYEKEMFDRAGFKLGLDKAVLQKMDAQAAYGDDPGERKLSKKEVEELLKKGAYGAFLDDTEANAFCSEDIDQILERRATVIKHDNSANAGSIFSKASFATDQDHADIDVNDPLFWDKFAARAQLTVTDEETARTQALIMEEPRQRRAVARAYEQLREQAEPASSSAAANRRSDRGGSQSLLDDDGEPTDASAALKWSPTEKLYFERRLMVYGVWKWAKLQAACPRRSVADLRVCARDLIRFLVSTLNPAEDAQAMADLEAVVAEHCDPFCNPPESPLPYPGATAKQAAEYKSFLVQAPQEYRDSVEKKARFMVARIQLLKQVHDMVPNEDFELAQRTIKVPPLTRPPAPWWGPNEDRDMLIGIVKHGYHIFRPLRRDRDLVFARRRYDPATFQENQKKGKSKSKKAGGGGDESDNQDDEENDDDEVDPTLPEPEDPTLYAWPSKSEIGARLRRVVQAVMRDNKKRQQQAALLEQQAQQAQLLEAAAAAAANPTTASVTDLTVVDEQPDARSYRWNKRERTDFFRTICCLGILLRPADEGDGTLVIDWDQIKESAHLTHKPDEVLDEYYNHMVAQCKFLLDAELSRVTGQPCLRPADKLDGDDEYTLDKARKLFKRTEFLEHLRTHVLPSPHIDVLLAQAKRAVGLPDWWIPGTHDKALLQGISQHGYSRYESLVADPAFPFAQIADQHRTANGGNVDPPPPPDRKSHLTVLAGLPWPKDTIITKRLETLCTLVASRNVFKGDPSSYTPPGYVPPPLVEAYPPFTDLPGHGGSSGAAANQAHAEGGGPPATPVVGGGLASGSATPTTARAGRGRAAAAATAAPDATPTTTTNSRNRGIRKSRRDPAAVAASAVPIETHAEPAMPLPAAVPAVVDGGSTRVTIETVGPDGMPRHLVVTVPVPQWPVGIDPDLALLDHVASSLRAHVDHQRSLAQLASAEWLAAQPNAAGATRAREDDDTTGSPPSKRPRIDDPAGPADDMDVDSAGASWSSPAGSSPLQYRQQHMHQDGGGETVVLPDPETPVAMSASASSSSRQGTPVGPLKIRIKGFPAAPGE